jgi:hypothetical protein
MTFFSLFTTGIFCIFYGLVATTVVMAILYAVLRSVSKSIVKSIPFYITGIVLAILLTIQFSLMIGAIEARSEVESAEIYLSQMLENQTGIIGKQDSQRILDAVNENFPIISSYIGLADFSGHDISEVAESLTDSMDSYLSSYIWHRAFWIIGIIIVSIVIVMLFDRPNAYKSIQPNAMNSRHERRHTRTDSRQRISRRR